MPKRATPLLQRVALFCAFFILLSAYLGQRIIGTPLLNDAGFFIYGGLGKALLFAVAVLAIVVWKHKMFPLLKPWNRMQLVDLVVTGLFLLSLNGALDRTEANIDSVAYALSAHAQLLLVVVMGFIASIGRGNIKPLFKAYAKDLRFAASAAAIFYLLFNLIYKAWPLLATVVLHATQFLMKLIGLEVEVAPGRTLIFDKFGVTIEQYCSGIESLALFIGMFIIIAALDWEKLNHQRLAIAFVLGAVGLFLVNILRVFILIVAGYYINPQIAFQLFHSYAGMLLFIVYFAIFWRVSYARLLKHEKTTR